MSSPSPSQPFMNRFWDRVIRGTGLTRTQNLVSWTVLALGFAYYWDRQQKRESKESNTFDPSEQRDWNQAVLDRQRAEEERKKRATVTAAVSDNERCS